MRYFLDFCTELLEERKKEKNQSARKNLLQLMLDAQLEGHEKLDKKTEEELKLENITDWRTKRGLTDLEIIAQCMVIFIAGFETTAGTLSYFAHSIAMNPDVQEKLYQEIEEKLGQESPNYDNVQKLTYLDMCMAETLRMYPIATVLSRESKEDCIVKGMKIPKDTAVLFPIMCLHYDPRYWTEPEKFDPEHFSEENKAKQIPFTYLPFGGGPRICAGMRLADLEFKMAVVQMLRKFRLVVCDKTEKKIEFAASGLLKPKNGIWLKIEHPIVITLYFYGRRTFGFFIEYGIKGPKPIAYFGNLLEISQRGLYNIFFDWKKKYGDRYGIFFGLQPSLIISDPEIIKDVMVKNFSNFTNRPIPFKIDEYSANMLLMAKDDHWKYLRTVLAPFYSSKRMREIVPLIEDVLKTFEKNLNKIADSKEATDVTILFSGYTMDVIASTGFGIKARKDLLQLMLDAQLEGHEKMDKKTEQDLKLENITDWRTKRGLTDIEIIAQCMLFFVAGFETTAGTLSYFAYSMAMNPDVQEKLYQEIKEKLGQEFPNYDNVQNLSYLEMCMDETLRMYPIALLLTRESKEDCVVKGMKIPKNTEVMFPVMCLHYDPRYWTDPEKFDPEHFSEENKAKQKSFTYLPFGGGPRICAGMRLAELEFKMAVVQMLRKFRLVACDKTEKKIVFELAEILKPKNGIWIKIEHR
ncbi:Cytochrome P450 3A12,Cytochrome P450 3A4,Cytochrome P450 3A40,Cytochrome P450 3A11,Cytochrome P450 3A27,Lithocholate 6-beta-hydroxylase,Cytochrome P450 3A7,Cytochrome P450 3A19,Cytochrome P450 3A21,Cytochrome P450 3A13,Thromboxane-A synthase [Acanthosepion pharaonis]|uniref:Cytochrome P450 n=1 Tax=Acanthosepion pharaonis TaxID=158019 RepID=A0A812DDS7_ACAPH|nr:Cytochrome P450 3A12,Cytochrome P450 3A4,Cytochrome P450 3A40,Cytochrome P450 3A11,Cytochrome P450 3A27,Lithocholate 6-beta-hydroxylase,Cytochrome P450 3A7,Cytochrome P450 3A19,Cytochrome P450 3A21,Cytochrome P450 3A13,Thromboxane-A synthase [Sepia pharaonis]